MAFAEPYAIRTRRRREVGLELATVLGLAGPPARTHHRRAALQPRSDRSSHRVPAAALTDRQREIVVLIAEGLTNQAIADRLGLTRMMVSQHIATILWQLGLASRYEITVWAIEQELPAAPFASDGQRVVRSEPRCGHRP